MAAPDERRGFSDPNIAIPLGTCLTGLSAALPWINVVLLGSLNLFNLYQVQEKNPVIPEIVVAAAIVVAALALARVPGGRMVAFLGDSRRTAPRQGHPRCAAVRWSGELGCRSAGRRCRRVDDDDCRRYQHVARRVLRPGTLPASPRRFAAT